MAGIRVESDRGIGNNGGQDFALLRHFGVFPQQRLEFGRRYLVKMGVNLFDPPEFLDQFDRSHLADSFDPGDVVRSIAFQCLIIRDVLRPDAVFGHYGGGVKFVRVPETTACLGVQYRRFLVHQLHQVSISGDDDGFDAPGIGLCGQRAQQVVGFKTFHFEDGDIKSLYELPHPPELPHQLGGCFLAGRLVFIVHLVAESGSLFIKSDGIMGWFQVINGLQHDGSEAVNRAHHFPGFAQGKGR